MNIKQRIKKEVYKRGRETKKFASSDIVHALKVPVSRQYVSLVLTEMINQGELVRAAAGRFTEYALPEKASNLKNRIKRKYKNNNLKEHEILDEIREKVFFLRKLNENVSSIFDYAFSEMLNNAIEHSLSEEIEIEIAIENGRVGFIISDNGVGVFRNIMKKRKLNSEIESIQDLLKGKLTTQPHAHSGEGIFFTSRTSDLFILESFDYRLRIDNQINDVFIEELKPVKKGTRVSYFISTNSERHLNDTFAKYQTDQEEKGFDKTELRIKLYTVGTIYVSRSQARRVTVGLEKFKVIFLDFDKVPTIGQAFADEIFRVFLLKNPHIELKPINMNEAVKFMIDRVANPSD